MSTEAPDGFKLQRTSLSSVSPGFYTDDCGATYFCPSEFFASYPFPVKMEVILQVLDEVLRKFPGVTVFEFADPDHP